jgi:hypothetical protein
MKRGIFALHNLIVIAFVIALVLGALGFVYADAARLALPPAPFAFR